MVTIVDADARWPNDLELIASEIRSVLGDDSARIDHIGSTSVPGLPSKDVIDVQVTVDNEEAVERVTDALDARGWRRVPGFSRDHPVPGLSTDLAEWRKAFLDEPPGRRPAHVHVRIAGRANARYALLFRDFLRSHPNHAAPTPMSNGGSRPWHQTPAPTPTRRTPSATSSTSPQSDGKEMDRTA